jgi:hypothetical protein
MAHQLTPLTEPERELLSSQASSTLDNYTRVFKDPIHDYSEFKTNSNFKGSVDHPFVSLQLKLPHIYPVLLTREWSMTNG